jgi:cellulose biosynthesis protein BcsQ
MIIGVYSAKGGVGKTTLAVNLAWASASLSSRRTLLWDLDPQGAATSLRHIDRDFHDLDKPRRLAKVGANLAADYDRIIIDCPPGLTDTSDQILRASDIVVVPVIPAVLSQRALDVIKDYLQRKKGPKVVLAPVFSMVDRRRLLHRAELEGHPGWPVIPMASAYERVSQERKPIGELLPQSSAPVVAIAELWRRIEKAVSASR